MSSKDDQTNSPTDTNSATDAIPQWSLAEWLSAPRAPEFTTVKCTNCKVPTLHEWFNVTPAPVADETLAAASNDFTVVLEKKRRTTLCTQCGLVKTIT